MTTKAICILGRQPALGLAELESLFGVENIQPIGSEAAGLKIDAKSVSLARLGGTQKVCQLLAYLPFTDWRQIEKHLLENVPKQLGFLPEGKLKLGLSLHGLNVSLRQINASGLSLKKTIRATGRSVRVVPNTAPALSTAQTIHNNLTGPLGMELVLIADGRQTALAQVVAVQNIAAYGARDQARPMRDARVGMLPPKLAQIIINLAVGKIKEQAEKNPYSSTILDPFCGTGVILQEAALMGYNVYGTDLESRMVEYSEVNLDWLAAKFKVQSLKFKVTTADATSFNWLNPSPVFIATETYLGRPFSAEPNPQVLREVMQDVDTIHHKFLKNVAEQTNPGFRMCVAVPAWKTGNGFKRLKLLDSLGEMGYTRQSFVHARDEDLIYHRPNQIVGRELAVLVRR